ncbi:Toll/interleukin-1 receptor domain-containing protein [Tanacetum coccineum]|uniref:Toll/interleukin-1 receptor domain-containing protein n=1 Tax=Tanacetum coccineum TaxID=301880 RepID=A0ABQ5EYV3_9ASTR
MVILTDVSEASSSSSNFEHIYDVFLSFRGADTRNSFTNHLHKALEDANLNTFLDDKEIETGLYLKPELESAIRASRASIIVLSKNYASSTWCLNELVLILEQHRKFNQIVIPIFYHVDPSDVRKQQNSFGDAMADHKQKMEAETNAEKKNEWAQKMEIWKNSLTHVANLKGKEPKDMLETDFIEEIVTDIYHQLGVLLRSTLPQDPQLIGIDDSIRFLSSWLQDGSKRSADILTILGMGGIGKTSLAKRVYKLHCHEFNRSSFVGNISRRCGEKSNGLLDVQKQLCDDISKASSIPVHDVSVYTSTIENALARKKSFLFLIDNDSLDSWMCYCEIKSEDLKKGYEAVSYNIVNYCEGHPLALKVLGRCLLHIDRDNVLSMHSLIQEMGRDEVRQESPKKPWKRSRLWCHEESFKVLRQKKGKEDLLGLSLDMRMLEKEKLRGSSELETVAFSNMDNLMILHLDYVQINGPYENFPEELRWLRMCGCPLKSVPSELPMENLVALDLSYSNIEFFDMSCSSHQRNAKGKKLLGSLKILDLSFSKQLRGVGGFCELPSLESLFLSNCSSLTEICESIDDCDELVFIDLSNCKDLRELRRTLANLKKVKTLLLDGCNKGELAVVEAVQRDFKPSAVYFPSSLVMLSLANNNLSNESFPMDLSSLSMLKELCLDGNPIVSMPDCVRTLPRLKLLFMRDCVMLGSIEHPPRTLRSLRILINGSYMPCIRKISFDQEMSPLDLPMNFIDLAASSIEIEGIIKIQPIAGVDDTILCSLGWSNLEFLNNRRVGTYHFARGAEGSRTQMYYELGIFSTIYGGKVMPTWIRRRRKGPSISFTIPSSPNKLRGLNLSYVQTLIRPYWRSKVQYQNSSYPFHQFIYLPRIKICNITKNLTWSYTHHLDRVNVGGKCVTFLSHWMFGENEMEDGDQVTISIKHEMKFEREVGNEKEDGDQLTNYSRIRECGVSFVYDDGKNEKEEDPLSYYKSWNHIIGGDLSSFQLTTQEYNLSNYQLVWGFHPFIANAVRYKERLLSFLPEERTHVDPRNRGCIKIEVIITLLWKDSLHIIISRWVYDQMPEPRWVISMGSWDVRSDAEALLYGLLQLYMRRDRNKISSKAVLIL